jgi:hypothetical protein
MKFRKHFQRDLSMAIAFLKNDEETLQSQADSNGITRERVRQVVNRMLRMAGMPKSAGDKTYKLRKLKGDPEAIASIRSLIPL